MKITIEEVSQVKKIIHIEVPADKVKAELNKAYNELKKNAKPKGFRPGKTPRSVLMRLYKKDVHADVTSKLIQTHVFEALKDSDFIVLGRPVIDPPELEATGPYAFDATIEVRPKIDKIDFQGLELKKNSYRVSDKEIDAQLTEIQKNMVTSEPLEEKRPLQEGDLALIDYEGFIDGKPFEETQKTENFSLKIGDAKILNDFDDALKKMQAGEQKTFSVTFPDDYFNAKIAGREIKFEVTLKEIRKEILPEINDELAKNFGQVESLSELKSKIADNLEQGYAKRIEQELNEQIFSSLIAKTDFELPETMIKTELDGIIQEAERSFEMYNLSYEKVGTSREDLEKKYRPTAEKQVRRHLILATIIEHENIELSDKTIEQGFLEMAESINQPVEGIKNFYKQNEEQLAFFKHTLLEKEAIKLILKSGKIEEIPLESDAKDSSQENKDES